MSSSRGKPRLLPRGLLYIVKAGLRAAASGGRPRAGSDTTVTGEPASPHATLRDALTEQL
jgi:hypothetical protein